MSLGLLLTALGLGLRHGIDWDHIAAIADLSVGTVAIAFGLAIPSGFDVWMGRIVGLTLIALGVWILLELVRKGRDFRLRSRWMLVINGTFAGLRRVRNGFGGRQITVEHEHVHEHDELAHDDAPAHDHAHLQAEVELSSVPVMVEPSGWQGFRRRLHHHSHPHAHALALPDQPDASYGHRTATGIGMLHGVGIESPTQIAIFVASSSVAGVGFGLTLLGTWVLGLIVANAGLAVIAGAGILNAERSFPVYATLAIIVSVLSVVLGTLYLFDLDLLPALS